MIFKSGQDQFRRGCKLLVAICSILLILFYSTNNSVVLSAPGDKPKKILFIFSHNFDYPGIALARKGFSAAFAAHTHLGLPYSLEEFQLADPEDEAYFKTIAADLKAKYANDKPDLVITGYKQATEFMAKFGQEIFGDKPVVFAGIDIEDYNSMVLPANFYGVISSFSLQNNIDLILRNHPLTKEIFIIAGASPEERALVEGAMKLRGRYEGRVQLVEPNQLPYYHMLAMINSTKKEVVVLYLSMQLDVSGRFLAPTVVARDLASAARIPVYGVMDAYSGSGIVGGFFIDHETLGQRVADISLAILNGNPPPVPQIDKEPIGFYSFDWRELRRWGIDEAVLPDDSKLEFREFSVWDAYKWQIISMIGLLIFQGVLILGLLVNRSMRLKAQKELQANEQRYRLLADNVRDLIWTADISGRLTYVSPYITAILDYSPSEVIGRSLRAGLTPAAARIVKKKLLAIPSCLATGGNIEPEILELEHFRKDGSRIWVETRFSGTSNPEGAIDGIVGVSRDITEKRRIQEQLLEARESRARSEKMASIGMLAAGIAHEINQPLNAIKLISSGLVFGYRQGRERSNRELTASLEEISRQTSRVADIIDHLRALIQRDNSVLKPCAINDVVIQSLKLVEQRLAAHGIMVVTILGADLPPVMGVATALEEVVINLLVNSLQALDAMAAGEKRIEIQTWYNYGVFLAVSDNGPGVSPKLGTKIFEPFVSTKTSADSLGLGLAIVSNIVTMHRGTIGYETGDNGGARFVVKLPVEIAADAEGED